jgi:hypothetical protein
VLHCATYNESVVDEAVDATQETLQDGQRHSGTAAVVLVAQASYQVAVLAIQCSMRWKSPSRSVLIRRAAAMPIYRLLCARDRLVGRTEGAQTFSILSTWMDEEKIEAHECRHPAMGLGGTRRCCY